ncbi:hypothetical protein [Colwellia sp. MEBiC06753]
MNEEHQLTPSQKLGYPTDELRTPVNMASCDKRNHYWGITTPELLYDAVAQFPLNPNVPEGIVAQYDTARNLYLYAFNVYRFYNMAQQQLYSVLELAIKEGVGEEKLKAFINSKTTKKRRPQPGLRIYMQYLKEKEVIVNADFPRWHERNRIAAENAYHEKVSKIMDEQNLKEYPMDYSEIDESQFDVDWDYIQMLCDVIPGLRNSFAHGSKCLNNDVLGFFEDISIIINKIYSQS